MGARNNKVGSENNLKTFYHIVTERGIPVEVYEAVTSRKSVRAFQDKDVPEEMISRLLEAARLAPSASNRQEWRFLVVRDPVTRKKLSKAARSQEFVGEAPVVLVCCAETDGHVMACGQLCYPIDVAIAIDHITLCATAVGLGTCWIGGFSQEMAKEALRVPDNHTIGVLLTLGFPKTIPDSKPRKRFEDIVCYESFSE